MLIDIPEVIIKTCTNVNPASLMPTSPEDYHSYEQMISQAHSSGQNISDIPLRDPEEVWSTHGRTSKGRL